LAAVDARIYREPHSALSDDELCALMSDYAAQHIKRGGRIGHVTRHMVGLFHGRPGARRFRQILSTDAYRPGTGPEVIHAAFAAVAAEAAAAA
jgi:tRNA-dihydrouridine synthase A